MCLTWERTEIMAKENAIAVTKGNAITTVENDLTNETKDSLDLDKLEEDLQGQLEDDFSNLQYLKEEKEKIGNPEALGKVIEDEIWKQFSNQIGLDITNETLNQKYDREHQGESYDEVGREVMKDSKYKEKNKAMSEKLKSGKLKDEYTGKTLKPHEKANLDHVVSRKEIYENKRRQQAGIPTKELANKDENLKPTNESLNKSKNAKSVDEYIAGRKQREKDLIEQNKRANKKIDESNMSDVEKQRAKEKNNKRLQDKLDANDKLMKEADEEARKAINKEIAKGVAKQTVKKAGKDALKQMAVVALSSLLKEVMNGLVRFLKSQVKSFNSFLAEMKKSIKAFFKKIKDILHTGASSAVGTIVTEIFGPIVSTIKKIGSLIKLAVDSVIKAVKYLTAEENKSKPFSVKVAQVGKIIIAGLVAGGAIALGEVFEKILEPVPGMLVEIPVLGTLANVIGMFLASLLCGIVGAIFINLIDKFIAKKQKETAEKKIIDKQNQIIVKQKQLQIVNEVQLEKNKGKTISNVSKRHQAAGALMKDSYSRIMEDIVIEPSEEKDSSVIDEEDEEINEEIDQTSKELDDLLKGVEGSGK